MKKTLWLIVFVMVVSLLFYGIGCKGVETAKETKVETEAKSPGTTVYPAGTIEYLSPEIEWVNLEIYPGLKIPKEVPKRHATHIELTFSDIANLSGAYGAARVWDQAGWTHDVLNCEMVLDRELRMIDDTLAKGEADVMIVNPADSQGVTPGIKKINDAGIPVFCEDRWPAGGEAIWGSSSDNHQAGVQAAEFIVDKLNERYGEPKGKVIALMAGLEIDTLRYRVDGMREVFGKNNNITVVEVMGDIMADPSTFLKALQDALTANPDADAVWNFADYCLISLKEGLEEIGMLYPRDDAKHVIISSIDGTDWVHAAIKEGYWDCTVSHWITEWGGLSAWASVLYESGVKLEPGPLNAPGMPYDGTEVQLLSNGLYIALPTFVVDENNVDDPSFYGNMTDEVRAYVDKYFK
jgi:ABC-type sugar transport system substrate-binding protein